MLPDKKHIITQLQKDILDLQGFKSPPGTEQQISLGPVKQAFPLATFPVAAVHEFLTSAQEHTAASYGFIASIIGSLMNRGGACIWISTSGTVFPTALQTFNINPERIVFIHLKSEKDLLWAMEEALRCDSLAAVVAEIREVSFTESRRLQLAVEQSRVTGFVIRHQPRSINTTAFVSRWRITPLASELEDDIPGVGFPRWNVELLKIRNGKPGSWQLEWAEGRYQTIERHTPSIEQDQKRKTG